MDITDLKSADESLQRSEERNRAILRAIPDLMFLQTADGVYLDYQVKDTRDLLVPPSGFLGKNMRDVLPPELSERLSSCFRRAQETDEPQVVEYRLTLDGEERWYEARIVTTEGDKMLSVVREITDRKRAEEALQGAQESLTIALEASQMGTWDLD
jgi:rsbT co-antagonist protein RsbR